MAIPLPQLFSNQPGGGINAVMEANNALARKSLENRYYAPMAQAEMASKIAYARYARANALAQVMASPAFATMDPTIQSGLRDQYKDAVNNPLDVSNMVGNWTRNNSSMGGGLSGSGGGLLNAFGDMLSGGMNRVQNAFGMGGGQQQQGYGQPQGQQQGYGQPQGGAQPQQAGGYDQGETSPYYRPGQPLPDGSVTPDYGDQRPAVGAQTPAAGQVGAQTAPGSKPITDVKAAEIQQKTAETAATGSQQKQTEQQSARSQQISAQAGAAKAAEQALRAGYRNYNKSTWKGTYAGSYPSSGKGAIPAPPGGDNAPEQLTDRYFAQVRRYTESLEGTPAGATDMARGLIAEGKIDRSMDPAAVKEMYKSTLAKLQRMQSYRHFMTEFYRNNPGATDEDAVGMMNMWDTYAPPYDYENGKDLPKNNQRFHDFTSPEALRKYQTNGDYNPYGRNEHTTPRGNFKPKNVTLPSGIVVPDSFASEAAWSKWHDNLQPALRKEYDEYLDKRGK